MTTDKQINANRLNAMFSTGPKSPETRKNVRMNALKHNHTGQTVLVHDHEIEAYKKHFDSFRKEYRAVGVTEETLVHSLADLAWSTQKVRCDIQNRSTLSGTQGCSRPNETHTPEIETAWGQAVNTEINAKVLNTLGIYEARKVRLFQTTLKLLLERQADRKAQQKADLVSSIELRKRDNETREAGEPEWLPNQNGFVCSMEEIDAEIAMQNRFNRKKGAA
jgi:hypothetical protein